MKRALFRWYVGDPDTPFWVYPKGWGWSKPSGWYYAKWMTRFSTYLWEKGGISEAAHHHIIHGPTVPFVPWSNK